MTREVRIVDVFTEKALAGNQLAVVVDGRGIPPDVMQRIAREMNFSETTFVLPPDDKAHAAKVRIFTPTSELPFAGHPTVGTAWVLFDEGLVPGGALEFVIEEGVGPVKVRGVKEKDGVVFWMTHPKLSFGEVFAHTQVADALGLTLDDFVAEVPAQVASTGVPFLFAALREARSVDAAVSDRSRLEHLLRDKSAQGVFMFAVSGRNHLYSRMFSADIAEDPATGGASGPLGAFAVKYDLAKRSPKVSIVSEQGTKMGRQSFVHIELAYGESSDIPERIEVGGSVVPVLKGTLADFD